MANRKIGFIGAGKMGSALMQGIIKGWNCKPENIRCKRCVRAFFERTEDKAGYQGID